MTETPIASLLSLDNKFSHSSFLGWIFHFVSHFLSISPYDYDFSIRKVDSKIQQSVSAPQKCKSAGKNILLTLQNIIVLI